MYNLQNSNSYINIPSSDTLNPWRYLDYTTTASSSTSHLSIMLWSNVAHSPECCYVNLTIILMQVS
jgi:hypothetical protein